MFVIYDINSNKCLRLVDIIDKPLSVFEDCIELREDALENCKKDVLKTISDKKIFANKYVEYIRDHHGKIVNQFYHNEPERVDSVSISKHPVDYEMADDTMVPLDIELFKVDDVKITKFEKVYVPLKAYIPVKLNKDTVTQFTVEDILRGKYNYILENSTLDYLLGFHYTDLGDVDIMNSEVFAITDKGLKLKPGQCVTIHQQKLFYPINELICLLNPSKVRIYINGKAIINDRLVFSKPTDTISVMLVNENDHIVTLKEFALAHK